MRWGGVGFAVNGRTRGRMRKGPDAEGAVVNSLVLRAQKSGQSGRLKISSSKNFPARILVAKKYFGLDQVCLGGIKPEKFSVALNDTLKKSRCYGSKMLI